MSGIRAVSHDNRGDENEPYGFVYFSDDLRCAYTKEVGAIKATGGWKPVTAAHVREAGRYLAEVYGENWCTPKVDSALR